MKRAIPTPHLLWGLALSGLCACQLHVGVPAALSAHQRLALAERAAQGCDHIAAEHLLRAVATDHLGTLPALYAALARFRPPFDDPTRCPDAPEHLP